MITGVGRKTGAGGRQQRTGRMRGDTGRCPDLKYSTPMPRGKLSLTTAVVRVLPSSLVALLLLTTSHPCPSLRA